MSLELNHWVYRPENHKKLMQASFKEVPEYVRRFTQDNHMCVYINPNLDRYGGPDIHVGGDGPDMFFSIPSSSVDSRNCAMSRPVPNSNEGHISSSADQPRGGWSCIIGL